MVSFEGVSKFQVRANTIGIPAANSGDVGEPGSYELGYDFLDHAFCNAHQSSHFAERGCGVAVEAEQDVHVVRQKCPVVDFGAWLRAGRLRNLRFRRLSGFLHDLDLAKTKIRKIIYETCFVCFVSRQGDRICWMCCVPIFVHR